MPHTSFPRWWGAPKKFDIPEDDRRVSWLELFYDLVYVIAIARITHHLALHISLINLVEYACLFSLIFWGWLNGSLYYDLHGNEGLRTRLMTLWQMMIIAALAIAADIQGDHYRSLTIVFMIMQLFITYVWWSVGFYDRSHRRYNFPYTVLFLIALALMGISLALPGSYIKWLFPIVLLCNYSPPFIAHVLLRRDSKRLDLSSSMFERLGLFTIIVFGETVLGIVNATSEQPQLRFTDWLNFALSVSIVFALWWIFFTMVSRREVMKGFLKASLLELLYIPALLSLGVIAICFGAYYDPHFDAHALQKWFGYSVSCFLVCIYLMMGLLQFTGVFIKLKAPFRTSVLATAVVFYIITFVSLPISKGTYQVVVIMLLVAEILFLNLLYYGKSGKQNEVLNEA